MDVSPQNLIKIALIKRESEKQLSVLESRRGS